MTNAVIFYSVAFLLILFALLTIKFENIVYSLLSAIVVFFITGVIFYLSGSEYNAIVQIAIYGVAVPVLLGLAVIFTERREKCAKKKVSNFLYFMLFISGLFTISLIYLTKISNIIVQNTFHVTEKFTVDTGNVLLILAKSIFSNYAVAFEYTGIILLIILAGLTIFKKDLKK